MGQQVYLLVMIRADPEAVRTPLDDIRELLHVGQVFKSLRSAKLAAEGYTAEVQELDGVAPRQRQTLQWEVHEGTATPMLSAFDKLTNMWWSIREVDVED